MRCTAHVPDSKVSKRTASQLSAMPLDYKESFLYNSCYWELANLARCALEAQVSPDTTFFRLEADDSFSQPALVAGSSCR